MKIRFLSTNDIKLIKRALTYIKPYRLRITAAFLCILSVIGFSLLQPLIWGRLIEYLFQKNLKKALIDIACLLIIYISQSGIGYIQTYLFSFLTENILYDFKCDIYKRILNLPVKAFDEMKTGDFISRMHGDTASIANVITNQLLATLVDILKIIFIGVTIFTVSLPLSLIIAAVAPVSYIIYMKYGRKIRDNNNELASLNDGYFSSVWETIYAIREVKSLGIKKNKFSSFLTLAENLRDKCIRISLLNNFSQTLAQGVNFISQTAVMVVGGYLIFTGSLKMQYYLAFTSYSNQFSLSILSITRLNSSMQQVLTSMERIFGLMDNLSYPQEQFGCKSVHEIKGRIKFENVCFEYNQASPVLKNVTFEISENKKVAITGISGSGKTTIFNLLQKFYSVSSGRIMIDDYDINELDEESIRKHISIVRQEPFLFNASIRDNLLLANSNVSELEMQEACKSACIHDYIMGLPDKYDSVIGENGMKVSGGQKQRIAIARALIKKSKLILFDEATSALDNESQFYIKKAIDKISETHTVVIIAHRLSTIIEADEIFVMDNGKISGRGTHSTLIRENQLYSHLYEAEFKALNKNTEEVVYYANSKKAY
jgi:ABC-type multidrug transport system fused ATPase/permease subunit